MNPVLQHLIDTDFADLQGSRLEGQFAITDELVNLGLKDVLNKLTAPPPPKSTAPATAPQPGGATGKTTQMPDPRLLLSKVNVDHLQYRTEQGRTVLEIKAGI